MRCSVGIALEVSAIFLGGVPVAPQNRPVPRKPLNIAAPGADYTMLVVGEGRAPLRDFYYGLLKLSWPATLGLLAIGFLTADALFALGYLVTGGVARMRPGSFPDAFYFSVQTMATIGYGAMFPQTHASNLLVVSEAMVGLVLTALATGLVFAKFSRPTARVVFTRIAVISPINGIPTLAFRLGNARGNRLVDVRIKVVLYRTEVTSEGGIFYRSLDVPLTQAHALSLARSWSALHVIDQHSPLYGLSPESMLQQEVELHVMVIGLDDISMQVVHARHEYYTGQIRFGYRLADVLSQRPDGTLVLDVSRFHETTPSQPSADFPYPR